MISTIIIVVTLVKKYRNAVIRKHESIIIVLPDNLVNVL